MDWITYVPEYDGNRERPESSQTTVELLPLTVREAKSIAGAVTAKRMKGGHFKTNQAELTTSMLLKHVRNFKNLSYGSKKVTTIEEFLELPFNNLATELENAIQDASLLTEGDVKNLRSQFYGSSVEEPGTANLATNANKMPEDVD